MVPEDFTALEALAVLFEGGPAPWEEESPGDAASPGEGGDR